MTDFYAELDAEALVIAFLKTRSSVTDLVPAASISSKLRKGWTASEPALRIRRIGGLPTEQVAQHLGRYRLQVDAFAETEPAAFAIIAAADLELRRMPSSSFADAVVTAVRKDLAVSNSPDPDSDAARYLFGAVLYAHRKPG